MFVYFRRVAGAASVSYILSFHQSQATKQSKAGRLLLRLVGLEPRLASQPETSKEKKVVDACLFLSFFLFFDPKHDGN